mmetsp:Transcript_26518/g.60368  ORF Transcript_26518/g.60368 Transcript_26518/m.60368 type:complete len:237 (-) Transcript_26518:515-1225(-)
MHREAGADREVPLVCRARAASALGRNELALLLLRAHDGPHLTLHHLRPLFGASTEHSTGSEGDGRVALHTHGFPGLVRRCSLHNVRLHVLETLRRSASSSVADHLCSQLAPQYCALHAAQELLARPVACQREVGDGRVLRRAVTVPAGDRSIHAPRRAHNSRLSELCAAIMKMGPNLRGEETLQLLHGGPHNLLITALEPVDLPACQRRAGGKDELQHRPVVVFVLLAACAHVGVD